MATNFTGGAQQDCKADRLKLKFSIRRFGLKYYCSCHQTRHEQKIDERKKIHAHKILTEKEGKERVYQLRVGLP